MPKPINTLNLVMSVVLILLSITALVAVLFVGITLRTRQELSPATGAILKTTFGDIAIRFEPIAPQTRDNFIKLARTDFYHSLRFHRVVDNFAIQTGDPLSRDLSAVARWGSGGPGYDLPLEASASDQLTSGSVIMVRNNGRSHGSQFMILVDDIPWLSGHNTKFASVTAGLEIVRTISHLGTGVTGIPAQEVWLLDIILQ